MTAKVCRGSRSLPSEVKEEFLAINSYVTVQLFLVGPILYRSIDAEWYTTKCQPEVFIGMSNKPRTIQFSSPEDALTALEKAVEEVSVADW
ncbi:unnamed protein product [Arctia plantaginis]|uniref:Uncharacterized protein n=1 Tax=Arctia plantaginis TaxID=874455 RepID=A0A8S1BC70_ARCPL|nr:unnamed protein product [Arctia plantaginis]